MSTELIKLTKLVKDQGKLIEEQARLTLAITKRLAKVEDNVRELEANFNRELYKLEKKLDKKGRE